MRLSRTIRQHQRKGLPSSAVDPIGLAEIAELLRVSRTRADQLVRQKGFPDWKVHLSAGRLWDRAEVEKWARENGYPKR